MSQQLKPAAVETAIVDLLKKDLKADGVAVDAVSDRSFDQDGNLVVNPPAALVLWSGASFGDGQDNLLTQYDARHPVAILCGARSLRGSDDERLGAQQLVAKVVNSLAGARLVLADGKTPPIAVQGVELFQFSPNGTWYSVTVEVEGFVNFDGANS